MKIRSQTSVLFIPLFIAFVLANGLYYLTGKSQEVEWGIQESIQAVAVTVNSVIEQYGIERGVEKVKNLLKKMKEKEERLSYLVGLQVYDISSKNILINWNLIQSKSIEKSASFEITKGLSIIEETEFGTIQIRLQ